MNRYSLILCLVLIISLSGVASAQVVLPPLEDAKGILNKQTISTVNTTTYVSSLLGVGKYTSYYSYTTGGTTFFNTYLFQGQAAIEFNLASPTSLPTTGMTTNNFVAGLYGLNVASESGSGTMNVDLLDMLDANEDGVVYYDDYNAHMVGTIDSRPHVFGGTQAHFSNNVDVTDAVRRDLFGAGTGQDFSGFILKSPDAAAMQNITYDPSNVELKVGVDNDGDGYPDDCDDTVEFVNPGATEICDDHIDNDCDGYIDSADSDCGGGGSGCFIGIAAR